MSTQMKQSKAFVTAQSKSGSRGLEVLMNNIDHMFEHNDWTPLAWLLSKTDGTDSTRLRAITNKVVGGVRMSKDKKQPSGMRITLGDNAGPTEMMTTLRELVENKTSFRSQTVAKSLLGKEKPKFDLKRYVKTTFNKLDKENVNTEDFFKAILELENG